MAQLRLRVRHAGLTVRHWLLGILDNTDRLSQVQDAESLGEFGGRTEKVGPGGDVDVGIFEYRGAQALKIPPKEWPGFAIGFFERILKLHGH